MEYRELLCSNLHLCKSLRATSVTMAAGQNGFGHAYRSIIYSALCALPRLTEAAVTICQARAGLATVDIRSWCGLPGSLDSGYQLRSICERLELRCSVSGLRDRQPIALVRGATSSHCPALTRHGHCATVPPDSKLLEHVVIGGST